MAYGTKKNEVAVVTAPNICRTTIKIQGTAPFVQCKFSQKALMEMAEGMTESSAEKAQKSKKNRTARNFEEEFHAVQHKSDKGWTGIPCPAFRAALVRASAAAKLQMTNSKMSVFILPDGFDQDEGTPLVKIYSPTEPEQKMDYVRLATGVASVVCRPMWRKWHCFVTIEYDADMITAEGVVNLLARAGKQVGVGCGRPFSTNSVGQGWGTFEIVETTKEVEKEIDKHIMAMLGQKSDEYTTPSAGVPKKQKYNPKQK